VVRHEQPYSFDDEEALARLQALADYWSAKHGVGTEWDGPSAHLKGRKLGVKYDARVRIGDGRVVAEVDVGFLAEKLGGPKYVRRKLAEYLDPDVTVEVLRARIPG